ncbi:SpoIIE family protein phosphatase [Pseudobutyrivibrio sp.]|uniref:SpoIIE family protein phosphatase n=1 Tax=Pseudobutyrivibrio sp. TaxID=2014367 RepID=UPI002600793E|nr:SpoIIE family protein phosphatase [Pseudobutyrivibrio sp.]MBR5648562.1 SpoIIE family protein phosphatase [Pseudobutyrivibrio sp.]
MFIMILKMSGLTLLYLILTALLWRWTRIKGLNKTRKLIVGIAFGISSILSTHFGVSYEHMVINIRDVGPLAAGLFFSPGAGVLAGLIGGIERYIVGTFFGVGSYTRIACSVSTCLAGFVALGMNSAVFKGKKPSPFYAYFMGSVMEVFHMYVVFITHREDMRMAFMVVDTCAIPMIVFTGICLALISVMLQVFTGEWINPFKKQEEESISVSQKFQRWLFIITSIVILGSFIFSFLIQNQAAYQDAKSTLIANAESIRTSYMEHRLVISHDSSVKYQVVSADGTVLKGEHTGEIVNTDEFEKYKDNNDSIYSGKFWGIDSLIYIRGIYEGEYVVVVMEKDEVYWHRNAEAYEIAFADILLFTVIYVLIALLVNQIVVNNIRLINTSLSKITNGDLNEVVTVRSSSEFASLSDDINQTVLTLKGYIAAAEKRIERELILARTIQESALPKVFNFPGEKKFDLFAYMKTAKEVGGDFYDFFFVDRDKFALVIADVSGKGIPAALFMMRSKTAIRSLAESGASIEEIIYRANNTLCEGNDAEMFVTVWIGIIDLKTGVMKCANAGHEYPLIKRRGGGYEVIKDKHSLAVAAMPNTKAREYEIVLEPGDRIFVYTDGIPEAVNKKLEQFGVKRIVDCLNSYKDSSIEESLTKLADEVTAFQGDAEQFDDITMLGFEFIIYAED